MHGHFIEQHHTEGTLVEQKHLENAPITTHGFKSLQNPSSLVRELKTYFKHTSASFHSLKNLYRDRICT